MTPNRKTLATGALLALLLLLLAALFQTLFSAAANAIERLHEAQFELGQITDLVSEGGKLQAELMAVDEAAMRRQFQTGDSASNAIGILQSNVSQLARENGFQLDSMATEPPLLKESISKLTIVLKSSGSEAALVRMLAAIERQGTVIVIERLTVAAQELAPRPNGPSAPGLSVEMRMSAYWTTPHTPGKPPP